MNKKTKENLIHFLEELLKKSNILDFKYIDLPHDNDVNFIVILKTMENIKLKLVLYCSDVKSITIYCPTLYKLRDSDSAMFTLNAINEVNSKIALGKIYLNSENNSVISYINRVLFCDLTVELTSDLLNDYMGAFLLTSLEFYKKMRQIVDDKE